jgi:hypothetical protein
VRRRNERSVSGSDLTTALGLLLAMFVLAGCSVGDGASRRTVPEHARVIVRDDFSDRDSGWVEDSDAASSAAYTNGRYRVRVTKRNWSQSYSYEIGDIVEAMRIEVDAVQTNGAEGGVGVVCDPHVGASALVGYSLFIFPGDRSAVIYRELEGDQPEERLPLAERFALDAIKPVRARNRIRAECIGATRNEPAVLALYVNGQLVVRAEDDDGFREFDGIGLITTTEKPGTTAFFDDVIVSELR